MHQNSTQYERLKQDRVKVIKSRLTLRGMLSDLKVPVPSGDGVKFSSPLRPDRNPSCTIDGERFMDWSSGEKSLDLIDFYAAYQGINLAQAIAELYARVSGRVALHRLVDTPGIWKKISGSDTSEPAHIAEKKKQRERWLKDLVDLDGNFKILLAVSRNLSVEAVEAAAQARRLFGLETIYGFAWVIMNERCTNAQARLFNGKPWPDANNAKAKTLPGSCASDPIYGDLKDHHAIALVEGGPDYLSVWHHSLCSGADERVLPVAMLGSGLSISDFDLTQFAGHRVRIFVHDDRTGRDAGERWRTQLESVGCLCDGFGFNGLTQADGRPVKDLNDMCRVGPDSWEKNHDLIENMMSFSLPEPV